MIAEAAGGIVPVRRLGDLASLIEILSTARLYVGCDAGPLHVAAAAGVPTVSLFRQSHPLRYAPLGDSHEAILVGDGSRAWVEAAKSAETLGASGGEQNARDNGRGLLCWDQAFIDKLL